MEPNKLEQEFRDKLEQRTIEPSKMAWDRLDAMLSVGEGKKEKKPNRSWMYMAASFVVFATIGAFFLTNEKENSGNGTGSNSTPIVNRENTVKPAQQEGSNDTIPPAPLVKPSIETLSAPKMQQTAVAAIQTKATSAGKTVNKQNISPRQNQTLNDKQGTNIFPPANNEGVAVVNHEGFKEDVINSFEADQLLATSAGNAKKKKSLIKVDANSLLSSVEGELNESFRDRAMEGVIKNFNAVKTSVANRNYQ
jgi:hypothetical protein